MHFSWRRISGIIQRIISKRFKKPSVTVESGSFDSIIGSREEEALKVQFQNHFSNFIPANFCANSFAL